MQHTPRKWVGLDMRVGVSANVEVTQLRLGLEHSVYFWIENLKGGFGCARKKGFIGKERRRRHKFQFGSFFNNFGYVWRECTGSLNSEVLHFAERRMEGLCVKGESEIMQEGIMLGTRVLRNRCFSLLHKQKGRTSSRRKVCLLSGV